MDVRLLLKKQQSHDFNTLAHYSAAGRKIIPHSHRNCQEGNIQKIRQKQLSRFVQNYLPGCEKSA